MSLPTMALGKLQKIADRLAGQGKLSGEAKLPGQTKLPGQATKPKSKKTANKQPACTIFCNPKIPCPQHHELVIALMNCSDHLGPKSNLEAFQTCVNKCIEEGWDKDDIVPDHSEKLRLPLVHLACAFAKTTALEWLITNGFDAHVKSETTGQFALQQGIRNICRAKHKGTHKELLPKIKRYVNVLKKQLMFHDDVNGDTPLHTAALMLTSGESKPQFYEGCIELITKEAFKVEYQPRTILDAINNEGKTALHILASSAQKVEYCATAIRTLVMAGADKTIRDNNAQTPLDISFACGIQNIVDELLKVHSTYGVFQTNMDQDFDMSLHPHLYPSPSLTDDSDTTWSEQPAPTSCPPEVTGSDQEFPPVSSFSIKQEEDELCDSCYTSPAVDSSSSNIESSSPAVLKYLGDAGLLSDVSALVARARAQDEVNMRQLQNQAKEYDIQIKNKERCIEKIKGELQTLQKKRKECDLDYAKIAKRIHSCENAMKALPNL